jgi:hypothetical protein
MDSELGGSEEIELGYWGMRCEGFLIQSRQQALIWHLGLYVRWGLDVEVGLLADRMLYGYLESLVDC